jgi:hypothetical protein
MEYIWVKENQLNSGWNQSIVYRSPLSDVIAPFELHGSDGADLCGPELSRIDIDINIPP